MEKYAAILRHILSSLYQNFGAALLVSALAMVSFLFFEREGFKNTIEMIKTRFCTDRRFRVIWLLVFYVAMMLFRTLFCRTIWLNPLSEVLGIWGLYDKEGKLYTENIENFLLFAPYTGLLFAAFPERMLKKNALLHTVWCGFLIGFLSSTAIELTQLFLKLGTFQVSDIFFNTVGGLFGGFVYWFVTRRKYEEASRNTDAENG